MRLFTCCFSAIVLCLIHCQDSGAETNSTHSITKAPQLNGQDNSLLARPLPFVSIKKLVPRNLTGLKGPSSDLKVDSNAEAENGTFDPFKPLFLFPILPFLFPPKEDNVIPPDNTDHLPGAKNFTKDDVSRTHTKPFVFFDFAFNIRQIPLKNETEREKDSNVINVKKLTSRKGEPKKSSRRRRNAKRAVADFFDDAPLFPDTELDEFLPKPDLFFPDLSFHPKPPKKLSRRKRDEKKPDMKNDLKLLLDIFDEAFVRTKKELVRSDPILNMINGMDNSYGEEKKEAEELFGELPDAQDNGNNKWKSPGNVKRITDDHSDGLTKSLQSPMIVVDKVVKIGEFHLHDDKSEGRKGKRKKKKAGDSKRKSLEDGVGKDEGESTEGKKWKRSHHVIPQDKGLMVTESKGVNLMGRGDGSNASVGSNATAEAGKGNGTEKYADMLKTINAIKEMFKAELVEEGGKLKGNATSPRVERRSGERTSYEVLKKNITEVLSQFLRLVKMADKGELKEGGQEGGGGGGEEEEELGVFDWTEKEILDSLRLRHKKEVDFPAEYAEEEGKGRQVADLNFLFLTVTLPTVLVFTLVLLVCFFNLRVKGKICTKLFNPRRKYVIEDETPSASKPLTTQAKA